MRTVIEGKSPSREISRQSDALALLRKRLDTAEANLIDAKGMRLSAGAGKIESLSPLAVLGRGYSITRKEGKVVTSAASLKPGDVIETRLSEGVVFSSVTPPGAAASPGGTPASAAASSGTDRQSRRRTKKKEGSTAVSDTPDLFS